MLPPHTAVLKLLNNSSAMTQAHDNSKLHPLASLSFNDMNDSLMQDRDESEVPKYMGYFQRLMIHHKLDTKSRRTFFWLVCNFERKIQTVSVKANLRNAHARAGTGAFQLYPWIAHWLVACSFHEGITNSLVNVFQCWWR